MCHKNVKNIQLFDLFFQALNTSKLIFGRRWAPDPAGGAHDAPPDPPVGWGGRHPSDTIPPRRLRCLDLGASVVRPPTQIPGYACVQKNLGLWAPLQRDDSIYAVWHFVV